MPHVWPTVGQTWDAADFHLHGHWQASDAVGNLAGYTYPNGVTTALQYDPLNRLTALASQGPQGAATRLVAHL